MPEYFDSQLSQDVHPGCESINAVFDRMSARGAHLILGARGEALIRKGRSLNIFQKT